MSSFFRLGFQYARFGVVGLAATAAHITLFALLIEVAEAPALVANLLAFCSAILVSFAGHFWWTFRAERLRSRPRAYAVLVRFVGVALCGLGLNSLVVYLIVELFETSYRYAILLMVSVVPRAVVTLSQDWAFGSE